MNRSIADASERAATKIEQGHSLADATAERTVPVLLRALLAAVEQRPLSEPPKAASARDAGAAAAPPQVESESLDDVLHEAAIFLAESARVRSQRSIRIIQFVAITLMGFGLFGYTMSLVVPLTSMFDILSRAI